MYRIKYYLASVEVQKHIIDYFSDHLQNFNFMFAVEKSVYEDDEHLFMVVGRSKSDGTYAVWSCWNDLTQSLNFGHYQLTTLDDCYKVLDSQYFGEPNSL